MKNKKLFQALGMAVCFGTNACTLPTATVRDYTVYDSAASVKSAERAIATIAAREPSFAAVAGALLDASTKEKCSARVGDALTTFATYFGQSRPHIVPVKKPSDVTANAEINEYMEWQVNDLTFAVRECKGDKAKSLANQLKDLAEEAVEAPKVALQRFSENAQILVAAAMDTRRGGAAQALLAAADQAHSGRKCADLRGVVNKTRNALTSWAICGHSNTRSFQVLEGVLSDCKLPPIDLKADKVPPPPGRSYGGATYCAG